MAWGDCRYLSDFREGHTKRLDEDGLCEPCAGLLKTLSERIAAGNLVRPDPTGMGLGAGTPIPLEPRPANALADCAACGERFNNLENQRPYLGADGRWHFVHGGGCWTLLHSA